MRTNMELAEGQSEDITGCRVQDIGLQGFAECMDAGPKACPYALPFGYAFLCQHPRLAAMIQNTQKEKLAGDEGG